MWLAAINGAAPTYADNSHTTGQFFTFLRQEAASECQDAKRQMEQASSGAARDSQQVSIEMACNCLPGEIATAAAARGGFDSTTPILKDEGIRIATGLTATCGARALRVRTEAKCRNDDKAGAEESQRDRFCSCLVGAYDKTADEQLYEATLTMARNAQLKSEARKKGQPEPKTAPTLIEQIISRCRAIDPSSSP